MNNEPVAWIEEDGMVMFDVKWASQMQGKEPIPLYPHLVDLTDEEIDRVVDETYGVPRNPAIYAMHRRLAKAILKKASEK